MRELIVSAAPQARVADLAKRVVEEQGGVVARHTHRLTSFDHLHKGDDAWSRSGFVGTFQPFGNQEVRVRVRVWASLPRKLFYFFVLAGFVEAVIFFLMTLVEVPPGPNVWVWTAIATLAGIGVSLLTYSTSWATSGEVEESLARSMGAELREDPEVPGHVYSLGAWKEHRADVIEAAVLGAPAAEPNQTVESGGGLLQRIRRPRDERAHEPTPAIEEPPAAKEMPQDARRGLLARFRRSPVPTKEELGDEPATEEPKAPEEPPGASAQVEPAEPSGWRRRFSLRRKKRGDDSPDRPAGP